MRLTSTMLMLKSASLVATWTARHHSQKCLFCLRLHSSLAPEALLCDLHTKNPAAIRKTEYYYICLSPIEEVCSFLVTTHCNMLNCVLGMFAQDLAK